jgi:hypothetical protein
LYVGEGWMRTGASGRLTSALDRVPGLLYSVNSLPAGSEPVAEGTTDDIGFRVRIALTQAHAAILHPDDIARRSDETEVVIHLARNGFRRRIPLLAIADGPLAPAVADGQTGVDRWVALRSEDIASALQDLVDQSAEGVKRLIERSADTPLDPHAPATTGRVAGIEAKAARGERNLPVAAIMAAFEGLKSARPAKTARD